MEILQYFTGVWFKSNTKETISIIHCDELYIVMRVFEPMNNNGDVSIETIYTKSYSEAIDWYRKYNEHLMWNMVNR